MSHQLWPLDVLCHPLLLSVVLGHGFQLECLPSLLVGGWGPGPFSQSFLDLPVLWVGGVEVG